MIYLTGDTHADFHRLATYMFPVQKEMTKDDYVIILGDFGGVWEDSAIERWQLDWLNDKPFTTLFIDGNHDNFNRLENDFQVVDFNGGKAHKIRDSVLHLMRGQVFELQGKSFFCMGGAASHDIQDGIIDPSSFKTSKELKQEVNRWRKQNKMFRIKDVSWWPQEMPSEVEMQVGRAELAKRNFKVDYVLTHCLPSQSGIGYKPDKLTKYFDSLIVDDGLQFELWWSGHYHKNERMPGGYNILYDEFARIV